VDFHKIPIGVTGLQLQREHGPAGPAFLRLGRTTCSRFWRRSAIRARTLQQFVTSSTWAAA